MNEEKRPGRYLWRTILILSLIVILFSVNFLTKLKYTFDVTMEFSGSDLTLESLNERDIVAMRFLVGRPFWDEIWFGILGLFCAWGLKKRVSFAWKLGVFWSIMLIASGIIIAFNELVVSGWDIVCLLPINFLVFGLIALVCLLRVRKEYQNHS